MAENMKSALHDATPSWNGFLYQGKVGLYVCLKKILEKITANPSDDDLSYFLKNYSIEYEWIEDFAIKVNDEYESLHQVKHKAGTSFSSHMSAIVTILNRKQKILSETDFNKYIKFHITDREDLFAEIHKTFDLMIAAGYITPNFQLEENWKTINEDIGNVDILTLKKLLTDFDDFSKNAFDSSKVYFHTSEQVSVPQQDINLYSNMPERHMVDVNKLRTLSPVGIYLSFDNQTAYELALSDEVLETKLLDLITGILSFTQVGEVYLEDDKKMFLTALYELVDSHIVSRHNNIRTSNTQGAGFVEQRDHINFSKLYEVLTLKLRNTNEKYWELSCRQNFEQAFIEHTADIQLRIDQNQDNVQSKMHFKRLQQFRIDVLSKYKSKFSSLLRLLFPHEVQTTDAVFFSSITEKAKIQHVFLLFIWSGYTKPTQRNEIISLL